MQRLPWVIRTCTIIIQDRENSFDLHLESLCLQIKDKIFVQKLCSSVLAIVVHEVAMKVHELMRRDPSSRLDQKGLELILVLGGGHLLTRLLPGVKGEENMSLPWKQ